VKILLLTDMPPCKNITAGLVLDQLCRFLPHGSLACFAVVEPNLHVKLSPDLDWIPIEYYERPRERWVLRPRRLGKLVSLIAENTYSQLQNRKIVSKAVEFGRKFNADAVWCILEGQTMIRLAVPVSKALGIPLLTEVWDPPFWWLRANGVDPITRSLVLREFDNALRKSSVCATASWAMAEQYKNDYGTRSVPVIPSLDASLALPPADCVHPGTDLIIGMAGQIYATEEWNALIKALDSVNWEICGRSVRIRLMGRYANLLADGKMNIEFLGWTTQKETIRLMSESDLLYCPYWFNSQFETVARLSFPSKLTTYLAAGRPVLFHGPEYASPARFLSKYDAGLLCHSLESKVLVNSLTELVANADRYNKLSHNGMHAFEELLTLSSMRKSFAEFLQLDEDSLLPL
jgi:glycosyltransferase involved in cell wall biosynthesis